MLRELKKENDPYRLKQKEIYLKYPNPELPVDMNQTDILPRLSDQPTFNQFLMKVKDDVSQYLKDL